jgi:dihydroorotate dehydrogenase
MVYVENHASVILNLYAGAGKPLIVNISGNGVDDTIELLKRAIACGFKIIKVNGACPNKPGQPMICWDKNAVNEFFQRIEREIDAADVIVWWKVSLGMPLELLDHNLNWVIQSSVVAGIVTGNTVPNVRLLHPDGTPAINTANGITAGGMAGPAVHALALDAIEYCAPKMPAGKIVIGCGGFGSAPSILRGIRAGATLIGMQSAWRESGFNPPRSKS